MATARTRASRIPAQSGVSKQKVQNLVSKLKGIEKGRPDHTVCGSKRPLSDISRAHHIPSIRNLSISFECPSSSETSPTSHRVGVLWLLRLAP